MAARGFRFYTGDVNWLDYGGTWIRKVGPRSWHFIELTNMDDACGSDNDGRPRYVVELSEVDLKSIGESTQSSAWKSCDGDCQTDDDTTTDERDVITAGCCFSYGAKAPLHSAETNNGYAGFRECRAESYNLTRDADAYAAAMDRPVNRIGSTAREYMTGDLVSAVERGAEAGNTAARIMAKVYVAANGQTLGGQLPADELARYAAATKD